jgi:PAS domain S-box-containing protein
VAVGARGRITLFNRAAEALAGVPAATLRGQPAGHLPVPLARLLEATAADGEPRSQVELALPNAAGQLIPLVCSTSPLVGGPGTRLGAVAVFSDLSRLKERGEAAGRAPASWRPSPRHVHEIRNPGRPEGLYQLLPTRFDDPEFRGSLVRWPIGRSPGSTSPRSVRRSHPHNTTYKDHRRTRPHPFDTELQPS